MTLEERILEAMRPMYAAITTEHKRGLFDQTVTALFGAFREAIAEEREACAMVAGDMRLKLLSNTTLGDTAAATIAAAIRARGK